MGRTVSEISQLAEEVLGATANLASLEELLKFEVVSAEIQDHLGLALERAAMERNWAGGGLGLISDQELDATSVEAAIGQIQGYLQTELDRLQASYLAEELERQRQAALEAEAKRKAEEERLQYIDAVPLDSEKGVDYTRLRDLLKAGQWEEADQETLKRMLEATGRTKKRRFQSSDLLNFPCADLKTIDQLWVRASQGRYGFSVQKEIYVKCGGKLDGNYPGDTIWYKFCEEVGWRKNNWWGSYSELDWVGTGVPGHLPVSERVVMGALGWRGVWCGLFSRIETCRL